MPGTDPKCPQNPRLGASEDKMNFIGPVVKFRLKSCERLKNALRVGDLNIVSFKNEDRPRLSVPAPGV
jgi:hypothetical protein